jgi:hypothetical protein
MPIRTARVPRQVGCFRRRPPCSAISAGNTTHGHISKRGSVRAHHALVEACWTTVRPSTVPHLVPLSQTVTTPVPWPRRQTGAFLACANATYKLDGTTLGVAVLVDASNAQRPAPPLPELQPDPVHPGLLTGHELGNIGFPQGGIFNGAGGQAFNTHTIRGTHLTR